MHFAIHLQLLYCTPQPTRMVHSPNLVIHYADCPTRGDLVLAQPELYGSHDTWKCARHRERHFYLDRSYRRRPSLVYTNMDQMLVRLR